MENEKELPVGWVSTTVSEVADVITGNTPLTRIIEYYGGKIPFIQPPQLKDTTITNGEKTLSKKGASVARCVPKNTILVSCIGTLGRTGLTSQKSAFNQQINAIICYDKIDPKFIFYQSQTFRSFLESVSSATTLAIVNKGNFRKCPLNIAPLPEQHRIVAKIEELFSELDKGVESLKTAQQQLKVYRQAVLKCAFEGKLTEEWRKCEWKWTSLGEFADTIKIGPFGTLLHESDYVIDGIPVINPKHIKNQKIFPDSKNTVSLEKAKELASYILKENDVILGRRGEMGRSAFVTKNEDGLICGTGSMLIRLKDNNLAKLYSMMLAEKRIRDYLINNCKGTTMSNLNEKIVKKIPVPIIPLEEQHQIVQEIESRLSVCDKMEETIEQSIAQAVVLRQSILKKAFQGKLVSQDPNDEPADKHLARIRAEREAQQPEQRTAKRRATK